MTKSVRTLSLRDNILASYKCDDLVTILLELPENIKSLDLSDNALDNFSDEELIKIIKAIPKHVTTFKLGDEGFKSAEKIQWLTDHITENGSNHINELILNDKTVYKYKNTFKNRLGMFKKSDDVHFGFVEDNSNTPVKK